MKLRIPAALGAALACAAAQAAPTPFSVHDLVRLERVSSPQLSPDERYVAYQLRQTDFAANKGSHGLWLVDLAQKPAATRRLTAPGFESNTPRWGSDGRLYFLSTRSGTQQVWRLDLAGGEAQPVTDLPLDVGAFRIAPDGRHIAVALEVFPDCADLACSKRRLEAQAAAKARGQVYDALFVRHWDTWKNGTRSQLFVGRLEDGVLRGEPRRVALDADVPTKPFGDDEDFVFTPDSRALIFVARLADRTEPWSTNTDLWLAPLDGAQPPQNLTAAAGRYPGYDLNPVVSPDGRTLAWRSMARAGYEADRSRIMLKDLTGRSPDRELAAAWDRSAAGLAWSADGRTLYATAADLGQQPLFAIDPKSGKVTRVSGPGFVSGFSAGRHVVAWAQDDLRSPAQVFMAPRGRGQPTQLTRHNAALLAERALGEAEQFRFDGAGGDKVYAHVVKPANFEPGRKYPVAFVIHGGPQVSMGNHWHYRWNPQTYAGAGYAVVFVDFHGSPGYGQAFSDAIRGDWGGKPLEDLQKGWAAALARYDFLDGTRACALGASYGGFMINWIAGQWPDAFRCLVNHDGIFDLAGMAYATEELWFPEWEFGGTPYEQRERYEAFNPAAHVLKWRTPMLVIQGGLDYRIPDTQGLATFTALQRRGIESRLLYFPNENHWVLKPHNSVQWHETVEAWLRRWTGS